jgi:hypothetical protein
MSKCTEKYKTFLYKYFHEGSWWVVEISATNDDDAQARINKLPLAQPMGVLVMKLPASTGVLARLLCWARNLFYGP